MIDPGDEWDHKIQRELNDANIIIILTSSASLSTEYITETEIPAAIKMHEENAAILVPLVLESCRWAETPLGKIQALPEKGKPVNVWKPQSEAWMSVSDGLATICSKLISQRRSGGTTDLFSSVGDA
jgi:hypothetical protein